MPNHSDRFVELLDNRRLGYHDMGDPQGIPCIYTPGWPGSGLLGKVYDEAARQAGVRWISVDKPGMGQSSYDPSRSMARYAADIRQLVDCLGIDRFAAVGDSAGGPQTLAVADALGRRIITAIVIACMAPPNQMACRVRMSTSVRTLMFLAVRAPWLLRLQLRLLSHRLEDPKKAGQWLRNATKDATESERRALEKINPQLLLLATAEALSDHGRSAVQELSMLMQPWRFDLSGIACPVQMWHGALDIHAPAAYVRVMAQQIPSSRVRIVDGAGHGLGAVIQDELMTEILRAARRLES